MQRRGGVPLVIVFHGGASGPDSIAKASAMHRLAEEKGFAVAYPVGTKGHSGLTWRTIGRRGGRLVGDPRFVRRLIVDLQRRYDIDPMRIYLAGFSIGGSLVYQLGALFDEHIAAIAVVGGTMLEPIHTPTRPVPLIHIHGTKDRYVPLEGGRGPSTSASNMWPPVQAGIDWWRAVNGCEDAPTIDETWPRVKGFLYGRNVELWVVEGGGHAWPSGRIVAPAAGVATPGFSASQQIWRFFAAHPRRRTLATGAGVPTAAKLRPGRAV